MGMSHADGGRPHALVVGGTGMLRGLTLSLARQGYTVSVIARSSHRLRSLVDAATPFPGRINPVPLDYRHGEQLRQDLTTAVGQHGPLVLAVCWIHSTAPEALPRIAEVIGAQTGPCRLFHVRGSAAANPADGARRPPEWLTRFPNIRYRQVILGFVVEGGGSRWLTHEEISGGVLSAVQDDAPYYVVGPWNRGRCGRRTVTRPGARARSDRPLRAGAAEPQIRRSCLDRHQVRQLHVLSWPAGRP